MSTGNDDNSNPFENPFENLTESDDQNDSIRQTIPVGSPLSSSASPPWENDFGHGGGEESGWGSEKEEEPMAAAQLDNGKKKILIGVLGVLLLGGVGYGAWTFLGDSGDACTQKQKALVSACTKGRIENPQSCKDKIKELTFVEDPGEENMCIIYYAKNSG